MSCVFPVTPQSPPECIVQAFEKSGYLALLNDQQRQAAKSDPVGWLISHPYLYNAYPEYFAETPPPRQQAVQIEPIKQPTVSTTDFVNLVGVGLTNPGLAVASIFNQYAQQHGQTQVQTQIQQPQVQSAVQQNLDIASTVASVSDLIKAVGQLPGLVVGGPVRAIAEAFQISPWGALVGVGLLILFILILFFR